MFFALNVEPIPPSRIVQAAQDVGEKAVQAGQGLAGPLVGYAVIVAGALILVGLVMAALGITKRILIAGAGLLFGAFVVYMFVHHAPETVGIIRGIVDSAVAKLR